MNYAIIAAGQGSRLVQEGVQKPKPLVELNGEPMIARLIRIFAENNAESISVIVNEEMTEVKALLDTLNPGCELNVVVKTTPSSMHSFYELCKHLNDEKFCLTTVDTIFKEEEFSRFIEYFRCSEADGCMAVTDFIDDEKPLYISTDKELTITGFFDLPPEGNKFISGGIYCLTPPALKTLSDCMDKGLSRMRNFQRQLVADGLTLKAYPFKKIVDVDHADDIEKAEAFLNEPA